jgi:hypothetical protein
MIRVAALQLKYHARFAGAALALETWAWQLNHPNDEAFPSVSGYPNETALIEDVKKAIAQGVEKSGKAPRVLVIGAPGRCGSGAVDLCVRAGAPEENKSTTLLSVTPYFPSAATRRVSPRYSRINKPSKIQFFTN